MGKPMTRRKKHRKKGVTDRRVMAKFSVCLPSGSVLGHIARMAGSAGRKTHEMTGWLLEAAIFAALSSPKRRLKAKKQWMLKNKCVRIKIPLVRKNYDRLTGFVYNFSSREHLKLGKTVEEMLLVSLEAFETLPSHATSFELAEEIRRTYLK